VGQSAAELALQDFLAADVSTRIVTSIAGRAGRWQITHGTVHADADQLEQVLINLVKNAIEAQGESRGAIAISACDSASRLIVTVTDEGPGIANPDNLFVPFFTTKPGGSGIGLVWSRQIAEAHGGTLRLENRTETEGAVATLDIPQAAQA